MNGAGRGFRNKVDTLVVGSGGNGQSYFMSYLEEKGVKVNNVCNYDGLKHMPFASLQIFRMFGIKRCVFVYNDPLRAIYSHYSRNWAGTQIKRLGNPYNLNLMALHGFEHYLYLCNLAQRDLFGIVAQFNNWFNVSSQLSKHGVQIIFVDFADLHNDDEKIRVANFLGKEEKGEFFKDFKIKARSEMPDCIHQYPHVCKLYETIYANMRHVVSSTSGLTSTSSSK